MLHICVVTFALRMPSAKTLARTVTKNAEYQLRRFKEGEQKMKVLSVLLLIGAYILGAYDGDSTAAVVLTMLLAPVIFERKEKRKCTTQNARNAVQH